MSEVPALERLKQSLQALASPAEAQLGLYPPIAAAVDELALDYSRALAVVFRDSSASASLPSAGRELLLKLDESLNLMSAPDHRERLWSPAALRTAEEWRAIRASASTALTVLSWPKALPPKSPDTFVRGA